MHIFGQACAFSGHCPAAFVDVVAHLSPPLLAHLRIVLGADHVLVEVADWGDLTELVRVRAFDLAIVEPGPEWEDGTGPIRHLLTRFPSVPVVVYTSLSASAMRSTVSLATSGLEHVVLRGFDDEPRRFRELIARQLSQVYGRQVLEQLDEQLKQVPRTLERAIGRLFGAPHTFHGVEDLAMAAGMNRRTLDRWLDRAGFAPARTILLGARLLRAYQFLRDPGSKLEDVTRKVGYGSPRMFARQVREVTGLTPSGLRRITHPPELVDQVAAMLRRRGEE
jgi:AraC-like DNA-binding protein